MTTSVAEAPAAAGAHTAGTWRLPASLVPVLPSTRRRRAVGAAAAAWVIAWLTIAGFVAHDVSRLARVGEAAETAGAVASDAATPVGVADVLGIRVHVTGPTSSDAKQIGRAAQEGGHAWMHVTRSMAVILPLAIVLATVLPAVALYLLVVRRWAAARRRLAELVATGPLTASVERILAERAVATVPPRQLARFTQDPLGDLAEGRCRGLAHAALASVGITAT